MIPFAAPAKVNLALDVLSRRADGYHEVRMINVSLALSDILWAEPSGDLILTSNVPELSLGEDNLILKAVRLLERETGRSLPLRFHLEKHIPLAAGLAGGSADAAAAMKACNTIYSLSFSDEELMRLGKEIGADVPYCLFQKNALSEGIGERLTELPKLPPCAVVLSKPREAVSTKEVFQALVLDENTVHPDIDGMIRSMEQGNLAALGKRRGNLLETVTTKKLPVIRDLIRKLSGLGAFCAGMSGSGPTVFALFENAETAGEAFRTMQKDPASEETILTKII